MGGVHCVIESTSIGILLITLYINFHLFYRYPKMVWKRRFKLVCFLGINWWILLLFMSSSKSFVCCVATTIYWNVTCQNRGNLSVSLKTVRQERGSPLVKLNLSP